MLVALPVFSQKSDSVLKDQNSKNLQSDSLHRGRLIGVLSAQGSSFGHPNRSIHFETLGFMILPINKILPVVLSLIRKMKG